MGNLREGVLIHLATPETSFPIESEAGKGVEDYQQKTLNDLGPVFFLMFQNSNCPLIGQSPTQQQPQQQNNGNSNSLIQNLRGTKLPRQVPLPPF